MKKILFLIAIFTPLSIATLFGQKEATFMMEISNDTKVRKKI